MGTLAEKLKYTSDSVNDIQAAINEMGVAVSNSDPLGSYGNKIRQIQSGFAWADYTTIEATYTFTENDYVVKDYSELTNPTIIQKTYTNL